MSVLADVTATDDHPARLFCCPPHAASAAAVTWTAITALLSGSGLHFLWSKNLVHRDLKPQNLLLTGPGLDATLKIADFGFARHLAQASMAETICGSPLYMVRPSEWISLETVMADDRPRFFKPAFAIFVRFCCGVGPRPLISCVPGVPAHFLASHGAHTLAGAGQPAPNARGRRHPVG